MVTTGKQPPKQYSSRDERDVKVLWGSYPPQDSNWDSMVGRQLWDEDKPIKKTNQGIRNY